MKESCEMPYIHTPITDEGTAYHCTAIQCDDKQNSEKLGMQSREVRQTDVYR